MMRSSWGASSLYGESDSLFSVIASPRCFITTLYLVVFIAVTTILKPSTPCDEVIDEILFDERCVSREILRESNTTASESPR